jgi:hypothetical protein
MTAKKVRARGLSLEIPVGAVQILPQGVRFWPEASEEAIGSPFVVGALRLDPLPGVRPAELKSWLKAAALRLLLDGEDAFYAPVAAVACGPAIPPEGEDPCSAPQALALLARPVVRSARAVLEYDATAVEGECPFTHVLLVVAPVAEGKEGEP